MNSQYQTTTSREAQDFIYVNFLMDSLSIDYADAALDALSFCALEEPKKGVGSNRNVINTAFIPASNLFIENPGMNAGRKNFLQNW